MPTDTEAEKKVNDDEVTKKLSRRQFNELENEDWLSIEDGESVIYWEHPHWIKYISALIFSVLLSALGAILFIWVRTAADLPEILNQTVYVFGGIFIIFGILMFGFELLKRYKTYYVITDRRLIRRTNIFRVDPDSTYFTSIQKSGSYKTGQAYVFGKLADFTGYDRLEYGEINLSTAGETGDDKIIDYVPDVYTFMTLLSNQRNKANNGNNGGV